MLKGIPDIISPSLLKILMEMGHGDQIVIRDANFPAESIGDKVIRYDGVGTCDLLEAILLLFPLDTYVEKPFFVLDVVEGDEYKPVIWEKYKEIISSSGEPSNIEYLERFAFYEQSKKAYSVIATGEKELYANIILQKGVVK